MPNPHHPHSEWLLTNGLGGFAMGCADGVPRRRYHAWLIAATAPPVGRVVALHSCAEWLVIERDGREERVALSSYQFADGTVGPSARACSGSFTRHGLEGAWEIHAAEWGVRLRRTLRMDEEQNRVIVRYEVLAASRPFRLELRPFTPMRDFHHLCGEGALPLCKAAEGGAIEVLSGSLRLNLRASECCAGAPGGVTLPLAFHADAQWWRSFEYAFDRDRGQEHHEDLPSPGVFRSEPLAVGGRVTVEAFAGAMGEPVPGAHDGEQRSSGALSEQTRGVLRAVGSSGDAAVESLVVAASQFVVRRRAAGEGTDGDRRATQEGAEAQTPRLTSVIAGYPWFSDWGRDTFISLRGLFLTTGRLDRAKEVLLAFASMREDGLIPNCFDNGSGKPEYNTVDASLWYLIAAAAYSRAAKEPLDDEILAACLEIIKAYRDGTAFGIKMDSSDGLIAAGDPSTQLTWMDARRDGVVFTPRHGKAVEINALWYAGLLEVAACLPEWYIQSARELPELAEWSGRNFVKAFWNEKGRRLYDCLTPRWAAGIIVGWNPIDEVRPNQVFSVSLPHSPLTIAQQRDVLACVRDHLLTPVGLRTLAPGSRGYQPRYEGRLFERDRAYHNGTVWPWLIGPYAEAVLRVGKFSAGARAEALAVLRPLLKELTDRPGDQPGPIGQLAEVYDADEPRRPQGCPAQAWSVAEVLRVYVMAMEPAACPT